jgi:hypothetical protein
MTRRSIILVVLWLAVVCTVAAERPQPPAGYSWQEVPEAKAALLKPDGWHYRLDVKQDGMLASITQEDVEKEGRFRTGLVVNIFPKSKPGNAVEYASAFITKIAEADNQKVFANKIGPLETFSCRVHRKSADESFITANLMVANPKTGTVYLFIFRAPEAGWKDAWVKGELMMNKLAIDDEL